jgi:hypothetical protein
MGRATDLLGQGRAIVRECADESRLGNHCYVDPRLLDDGDLNMLAMELERCSSVYIPRSGEVKAS